MDAPVSLEKPKERDCAREASFESQSQSQSESDGSQLAGPLIDDAKSNGKLSVLCPITPTPCRENGESILIPNSPLSSESPKSPDLDSLNSSESDGVVGLGHDHSPRTPKEGVFDPFAPGPEELLLAPICKKLVEKSHKIVAKRLYFDDEDYLDVDVDDSPKVGDDNEQETICEKILLDAVYESLLEVIFLKQVEDFLAENRSPECEPNSPPSSLTGIAETCLRAPMKPMAGKSRKIDPGLCRKLEF